MRELIERKRQDVVAQILKLEAKLTVYDELLVELPARPVVIETLSKTKSQPTSKPSLGRRTTKGVDAIDLALEAAGGHGITARELAEVASVPVGTASGRLSLLKNLGLVKHVAPRYFVQHSKHEDNNTEQGTD
jgi:hypothetical protein